MEAASAPMPDSDDPIRFLVDTSVLVNIQDVHNDSAEIWGRVITEILEGRLKTVRHVMEELERRWKPIFDRLSPYWDDFVVPDATLFSDTVIAEVRILQQQHAGLYRPMSAGNPADAFLIAVAKDMGGIVVTDEKRAGPGYRSKIPWVCTQRNVGSIDGIGYLRSVGCNV